MESDNSQADMGGQSASVIDLDQELILIKDAQAMFPALRFFDTSSLHRWIQKGLVGPDGNRHKLHAIKIGGKLFTTRQAIEDFIAIVNTGSMPVRPTPPHVVRAKEKVFGKKPDVLKEIALLNKREAARATRTATGSAGG